MPEIRIVREDEHEELMRIVGEAYPSEGMLTPSERATAVKQFRETMPGAVWTPYGLYRDGRMVGVFRNFDFKLNVRGNIVKAGGLGMLAVDLTRKKEHVAKEVVEFFHDHYAGREYSMTMLWPFRIDFYHRMGYGLGGRMYQYRVKAADLPDGDRSHVRFLTAEDTAAIAECYARYHAGRNGTTHMGERTFENWFRYMEKARFVGVEHNGRLEGFFVSRFLQPEHPESFMDNHLLAGRMVYNSPAALREMLAYLHSQLDQVSRVHLEVPEDDLYFLMANPTMASGTKVSPIYHESHIAAVGIMYRVLDTARLLGDLSEPSFGDERLTVKITLTDSFYPPQQGSRTVRFDSGRGEMIESDRAEVEIRLDIAEFSSLLMGAISPGQLHAYGLMEISDLAYLAQLDGIFHYPQRPICLTGF